MYESLIFLFLCLWSIALSQYKLGEMITCLENNVERPFGFKEKATYSNNTWCALNNKTAECVAYQTLDPRPNEGDVCDHEDPETGIRRNACKLEVTFGANETAEKTWSWKCVELSTCVLKENGLAIPGCLVTNKRINCCCNDRDFCTDSSLFLQYAEYGRSDHWLGEEIDGELWSVNYTELMAIDPGDIYVKIDETVPGYLDFAYGPNTTAPILNVTACDFNDYRMDIIMLVDTSCPMTIAQCEQQQIDIAQTMAHLRGTQILNIGDSNIAQVRIGYIQYITRRESTVIVGLDDNALNVDIEDADKARLDLFDIIAKNGDCEDPENRQKTPNLLDAMQKALDIFDDIR